VRDKHSGLPLSSRPIRADLKTGDVLDGPGYYMTN
jgi:hypothetical protein